MEVSIASEASMKIVVACSRNLLMWNTFLSLSLQRIDISYSICPILHIKCQRGIMSAIHGLFRHLMLIAGDTFGWQAKLNLSAIVGH
jgi:hypothetical protein